MEYLEIFKRGFRVANKNLLALIVQFLFNITLTIMLLVLVLAVAALFVGTLAGINLTTLKPEDLMSLLRLPLSVLVSGAVMLIVFIVLAAVMTAFVQAGVTGCLVDTARGTSTGFTVRGFFSHAKSSTFSMFRLYLLLLCIAVGATGFFALVSVIGFAVIMPIKDAGHQLAAFAAGFLLIAVLLSSGLAFFLAYISGNFIAQVVLVDKHTGASTALAEAYRFIRERFWDVVLFTIMVLVAAFFALVFIGLLFGEFSAEPGLAKSLTRQLSPLSMVETLITLYIFLLMRAWYVACYIPAGQPAEHGGPAGEDEPIEAELLEPDEPVDRETLTFDFNSEDKFTEKPPPAAP